MEKDVKEVKEVLVAVGDLAALLVEVLKDGVQMSDALKVADALMKKPELIAELKAAVAGIEEVPAELKDISLDEGVELAKVAAEVVKKVVAAAKV